MFSFVLIQQYNAFLFFIYWNYSIFLHTSPLSDLRQGATVPTLATVEELRSLSKEHQLQLWKDRGHSQHCVAFHLSKDGCPRGRGCAFLHVESQTKNSFEERDEVAGWFRFFLFRVYLALHCWASRSEKETLQMYSGILSSLKQK